MAMSEDAQEIMPAERYIRSAQREDTARISAILAEAFPALYTWTFGHLSTAQTASLLCALYHAGTLDFATTRLATQEAASSAWRFYTSKAPSAEERCACTGAWCGVN